MPALRSLAASRLALVGVLCVALVLGTNAAPRATTGEGGPAAAVAGSGPCTSTVTPYDNFSGQLSVEGGPLPASAVDAVSLSYTYLEQITVAYASNGTLISENCTAASATTTTDGTGGFSFTIALPAESCEPVAPSGVACTTYGGPYVPVGVTPTSPPPMGYALSVTQRGTVFNLTWVAELAQLSLTPDDTPTTFSTDAPGTFVATAEMANGTPSPLTPSFDWTVQGTGWAFVLSPSGGSATVEGAPGAPEGNLTVAASASVGSTNLTTPALRVALEAVPTSIGEGSVNRTLVDVGGPIAVTVAATGAAGYSYSAVITPGLGGTPTAVACPSSPSFPAEVSVTCSTSVTYPVDGSALLTVSVSNGYSSALWSSPTLTVDPAPALTVDPSPVVGYAGIPVSVTLNASAGSGTPPYASACFAPGTSPTECADSPGPTWTFHPTFSGTGNSSATAWVVDATGSNRSTTVEVRILGPLAVGALLLGSPNVSAGVGVTLYSSVAGGDLPARLWWNASDLNAPLRTEAVSADGPVSVEFVPPSIGTVVLSLTLVDALGTVAESSATVAVTLGPAASIVPARSAPSAPTVVGSPIPLGWEALNAVDEPATSFAATATLSVETSAGAAALSWLNSSEVGPLSSSPEATFAIPAQAWVSGALNLTLTPTVAGTLAVRLAGPGLPGSPLVVSLETAPDLGRLRLYDPRVAPAQGTTNRTFWGVSDRFGNPVPGAYIVIQYLSPASSRDQLVPVEVDESGTTGVWVNYSTPAAGSEVRVLDRSGDLLLAPFLPALTPASPAVFPALAVLVLAASLGGVGALATRSLLRREPRPAPVDEEEEARRLAEGRGTVLEVVGSQGSATVDSIAAAWEAVPVPRDLEDWIASLVADDTLGVRFREDGTAEFFVAPERTAELAVTVDEGALERAVARREAELSGRDEAAP